MKRRYKCIVCEDGGNRERYGKGDKQIFVMCAKHEKQIDEQGYAEPPRATEADRKVDPALRQDAEQIQGAQP